MARSAALIGPIVGTAPALMTPMAESTTSANDIVCAKAKEFIALAKTNGYQVEELTRSIMEMLRS